MRTFALIAGLAISVAALPAASQAACQKRTAGTIIGALTGGLLGHTVAGRGDRTEGALAGAAAGGVVGNQVSRCKPEPSREAYPATSHPSAVQQAPRFAASDCRYETGPSYDAGGQVIYRPTRVCGRF